jgi:serine/threonine-protein phosphatase 2A regulatory subunit A
MRRLFVVANAMGREETLEKLIPYLTQHIRERADHSHLASIPTGTEEDDEILLILAEQLGQFVTSGLIPGYRAISLLPILEQLCGVEETVVREKAVESLNGVLPLMFVDKAESKAKEEKEAMLYCKKTAPGLLLKMIKRMAGAEWFTAKVSAAAVLPVVYQFYNKMSGTVHMSANAADSNEGGANVEDIKLELRNMYRVLSEDETPMVRRGAAKHLAKFLEAVARLPYGIKGAIGGPVAKEFTIPGKDVSTISKAVSGDVKSKVYEEMVPIYQTLCRDEQDSVRLLAVSASGSMGCALGLDGNICSRIVLPVIQAGVTDLSWRVRNNLAKEFATVAQSQGFHEPSRKADFQVVFESYASLLQDLEAQVRTSAVENIARMAQLGGADLFQQHISPLLPNLADDAVMEVRSKLAQTIMDCCDDSICSTLSDSVILEDFRPCLECFLNDEFAEVQLHILSKLSRVTRLLDQMDVVVQSVVSMSKTANWRVRESVAFLLPHLAEARGVRFFQDQLLDVWMALLMDRVADVRSACVNGMPKLLSVTGSEWIQREIVPRYLNICNGSISYLTRTTVLKSFSRLGNEQKGNLDTELSNELVEQLLIGLNDRVSNVRMVAAKGLEELNTSIDSGLLNAKVIPALQQIVQEDPDEDCKFFADKAISTLTG